MICYILCIKCLCRASSIPKGKGGAYLQMKLVYNHFAPIFLFLLQWMDCSCSCLLSGYLNLFHVVVYKVGSCFSVHVLVHRNDLVCFLFLIFLIFYMFFKNEYRGLNRWLSFSYFFRCGQIGGQISLRVEEKRPSVNSTVCKHLTIFKTL